LVSFSCQPFSCPLLKQEEDGKNIPGKKIN